MADRASDDDERRELKERSGVEAERACALRSQMYLRGLAKPSPPEVDDGVRDGARAEEVTDYARGAADE